MSKPKLTPNGVHLPKVKDFDDPVLYNELSEAHRAIRSVGLQRRYVELDSGHVGMAPDAIPDDDVMILMGARTPFVLRKVTEVNIDGVGKKMVWVVIRECYLIGGMDGELVEEKLGVGHEPEEIYLV